MAKRKQIKKLASRSPTTTITKGEIMIDINAEGLRLIRIHLGWSQQKMANYAEAPISTYRKWEQAQRKPPEYLPRLIIRLLIADGILTREQVDDIITPK
jgi:DNA-binding transcriptional regulator YiaG